MIKYKQIPSLQEGPGGPNRATTQTVRGCPLACNNKKGFYLRAGCWTSIPLRIEARWSQRADRWWGKSYCLGKYFQPPAGLPRAIQGHPKSKIKTIFSKFETTIASRGLLRPPGLIYLAGWMLWSWARCPSPRQGHQEAPRGPQRAKYKARVRSLTCTVAPSI